MASTWTSFADLHNHIRSPLRPVQQDVATLRMAIAGHDDAVVLLGVTPQLAGLGDRLTAFDGSARMVAEIWPGDAPTRTASVADWLALPLADGAASAVIGDGALNSVAADLPALLGEIRRVLRPDGVAAFRTFCSPEEPETLAAIKHDIDANRPGNFHALKWRIAMALAAAAPDACAAVAVVRDSFDAMFPDREALAAATGWPAADIASIDYYAGATHSLCYPTERALGALAGAHFAKIEFIPGTGYPLAARCPTIVMSGLPMRLER